MILPLLYLFTLWSSRSQDNLAHLGSGTYHVRLVTSSVPKGKTNDSMTTFKPISCMSWFRTVFMINDSFSTHPKFRPLWMKSEKENNLRGKKICLNHCFSNFYWYYLKIFIFMWPLSLCITNFLNIVLYYHRSDLLKSCWCFVGWSKGLTLTLSLIWCFRVIRWSFKDRNSFWSWHTVKYINIIENM